MKPRDWRSYREEYKRLQEDLDAFLNVPDGVQLSRKYFATVRWLENRLSALRKALYQPKRI